MVYNFTEGEKKKNGLQLFLPTRIASLNGEKMLIRIHVSFQMSTKTFQNLIATNNNNKKKTFLNDLQNRITANTIIYIKLS